MAIKMLARMCRSEGGGRERHFARGNCGSKAECKQVGMGDDEAWQASPFAWREQYADSGEFNLLQDSHYSTPVSASKSIY